MADMPGLAYGRITGRFLAIVADTADVDPYPDAVAAEGQIKFTPSITGPVKMVDATPPTTLIPTPQVALLNTTGDIDIWLIATDGPISPTGWAYKVDFSLSLNGSVLQIPSFNITVPSGGSQDLTTLIPIDGITDPVPQPVNVPSEIKVANVKPSFSGAGIWFKPIDENGTVEMWVEDGKTST